MNDIYGNVMLGKIGIYNNREYVGEVVDKYKWKEDKTVKVYIPELMPFFKPNTLKGTSEVYTINSESINVTTDVGIIAKQVKINNEFTEPEVGDNVVVKFINGDVKKCVFYMYDYTY